MLYNRDINTRRRRQWIRSMGGQGFSPVYEIGLILFVVFLVAVKW